MSADIEIKDSRLCLSLESIVGGMDLEQKREALAWLATDEEVIDTVISHILGEDAQGWSTGDANRIQSILGRIEDKQISHSPRFNWRPWDELRQKIKDIRSSEHLYWVLYHKVDKDVSRLVLDELRRLGVEPNYTSAEGNEDVAKLESLVKEAFAAMARKELA